MNNIERMMKEQGERLNELEQLVSEFGDFRHQLELYQAQHIEDTARIQELERAIKSWLAEEADWKAEEKRLREALDAAIAFDCDCLLGNPPMGARVGEPCAHELRWWQKRDEYKKAKEQA